MRRTIAIALAAVIASSLLPAGPAIAAPRPHERVIALAGSARWLVSETVRSGRTVHAGDRNGGTVSARDVHGRVVALPRFHDGVGVLRQTGHVVVQTAFANVPVDGGVVGVQRVRVHDLATGAETATTLAPGETVAAAAPDGYVVRRDMGDGDGGSAAGTTALALRRVDGTARAIAVPFADGTDYQLLAGDAVVLAVTPSSDEQTRPSRIAWMSWARPGVWHPLYRAAGPRRIDCAVPSGTHAACRVTGIDGGGPGPVLLRLRDAHATWLRKAHPRTCGLLDIATRGADLVALQTSDAGACTKGRLLRLQDDGRLVLGDRRYDVAGGVGTAYGRILVSSGDQRRLVTVSGVTKRPVTVVRA